MSKSKSNKKYTFITPESSSIYTDTVLDPIKFYQICGFPNPRNNKYEVREVKINGYNEIEEYKTLYVNRSTYWKILHAMRDNKYRLYTTFSLDHIELPTCNDIALARSIMLNRDEDYTGYARFDGNPEFTWRGVMP